MCCCVLLRVCKAFLYFCFFFFSSVFFSFCISVLVYSSVPAGPCFCPCVLLELSVFLPLSISAVVYFGIAVVVPYFCASVRLCLYSAIFLHLCSFFVHFEKT